MRQDLVLFQSHFASSKHAMQRKGVQDLWTVGPALEPQSGCLPSLQPCENLLTTFELYFLIRTKRIPVLTVDIGYESPFPLACHIWALSKL